MNVLRQFIVMNFIMISSYLCVAVAPVVPVHVKTLTGLVTACANVATPIKDDVGSYMQNYIEQHFVPAAKRLAKCCTMATATFTGTPADSGVIVGVENNTSQRFSIIQSGSAIGMLEPGMNDVALHFSSLLTSSGKTDHTADITFVPVTGAQTAKVKLRVLSGLQLMTYITNLASAQGITFLKNGNNPLPGAGQAATTQNDQYLVVETVALTASTPLPGVEQRIQVLNLSNIANLYTVMLEINTMGLVFEAKGTVQPTALGSTTLTQDTVSEYPTLTDIYLASVKNVHILNEVTANTVPLLILPRNILNTGTTLNQKYALYVQSYANYIANQNAGTAPVYYDLLMNYCVEPYGYLHVLHYFDTDKALLAVVDQAAALASGVAIGNMIGTDVYTANLALSSDLSLVQTAQDSNGNLRFDSGYEHLAFGFNIKSMTNTSKVAIGPDAPAPTSSTGFPANLISTAFFKQGDIGINWHSLSGASYAGTLFTGNSTAVVGASYTSIGSFPSAFWSLTQADWLGGIHIVPVMYDVKTYAPLLQTQDFSEKITTSQQAAMYFYAFKAATGEFIGALPVLNSAILLQSSTYSNLIQFTNVIVSAVQSSTYATYGVATPGMVGLSNAPLMQIEYPGDGYWTFDMAKNIRSLIRNKMPDMSGIRSSVRQAWSADNGDGSDEWMVSVSKAAVAAGVSVQVNRLAQQVYEIIVLDSNQNILGFKQFATTEINPTLMMNHISSKGKSDWYSTPVKLHGASNVFTVTGSGNALTAVKIRPNAAVATVGAA